jgi:hypothetical protein
MNAAMGTISILLPERISRMQMDHYLLAPEPDLGLINFTAHRRNGNPLKGHSAAIVLAVARELAFAIRFAAAGPLGREAIIASLKEQPQYWRMAPLAFASGSGSTYIPARYRRSPLREFTVRPIDGRVILPPRDSQRPPYIGITGNTGDMLGKQPARIDRWSFVIPMTVAEEFAAALHAMGDRYDYLKPTQCKTTTGVK